MGDALPALRPSSSSGSCSSGYSTFSAAESTGSRLKVWKTNPIVRARRSASWSGVLPLTSWPSIEIRPVVGVSMQPMRFSSVDLPLPDGPAIARNTPSSMVSVTSCSAVTRCSPSRYSLETFSTRTRLMTSLLR